MPISVHNRRSCRFGLLIAAALVAGCSSSTGGTVAFDEPSCSGDHAVKAHSFCFIQPPNLHREKSREIGDDEIALETDDKNVIDVRLGDIGVDTSTLSNSELLDRMSREIADRHSDSYQFDVDTGRFFYTAAGRALGFNGTGAASDGTGTLQENIIFHGSSMLQVICLWTDKEKDIRPGCTEILRSLKITAG
ncbi:MAG TPA: hypothetical protein VHC49_04595 [Mycobacteriales bacterium]|nr:hypothetical protein [Mycobacteriales bacterium]